MDGFIDPHGGFRNLKSYQMSEIVYDATMVFCDRWIGRRSRTHDQMVQAARSGKQNIAEGSMASGTSKKFELKLVGVARASLEELLAPAWKSCYLIIMIFCGSASCRFGKRIICKRSRLESSLTRAIGPI
jgi:hypothetical protein